MKKILAFKIFLVVGIILSFSLLLSSICDDEGSRSDVACALDGFHKYGQLIIYPFSKRKIPLNFESNLNLSKIITTYLAMREKSPPTPSLI